MALNRVVFRFLDRGIIYFKKKIVKEERCFLFKKENIFKNNFEVLSENYFKILSR